MSDASTDVIARVEWSNGSRDVLLQAGVAAQVLVLDRAPENPHLTVLDPQDCQVLGSIDLESQTNWFNVGNALSANQVYDGPITLADGPKSIQANEFATLSEDHRCARQ